MKMVQRSQKHKIIGGVCGGIGEYFDIDPVFIRLLFVIVSFFYGVGVIAYIVLWIIIPSVPIENAYTSGANPTNPQSDYDNNYGENNEVKNDINKVNKSTKDVRLLFGSILLLIGILIFLKEFVPDIKPGLIWSILSIIIGNSLIIISLKKKKSDEN